MYRRKPKIEMTAEKLRTRCPFCGANGLYMTYGNEPYKLEYEIHCGSCCKRIQKLTENQAMQFARIQLKKANTKE